MTPKPQESTSSQDVYDVGLDAGERVVISGMAGLFPDSYDVKQLSDILYNKVNPVKLTNRWKFNHPEVASYTGVVPDLPYFDAQFFKVHYLLCNNMDAMARKILEQSFQAIYDAGVSPEQLSGKKVGVYIGTCFSETEKAVFYTLDSRTGMGIAGCNKSMFANRISYWLNAKGPSMSIDVSCCSSTAALESAYLAISRGECEAAIVGGGNLCLHPHSSVHYGRIMMISKDGNTKSFNDNATGCSKSEAINVLFLQKAKDALRIYADVVHVKCEYTSIDTTETGPKYGFYRKHDASLKFMNAFYEDANVSPDDVEYVEAFGSAIPEVDKAELEVIDTVYCKNRKTPLLVGSVMSNIGYGEAASGISAVTKVLLGYHHGKLAANLNCDKLRQDVAALREGRIQILQEHQKFNRTYAAINGLSITGVNSHILLHGHYKPKDINRYKCSIPRLVLVSGRQESAVQKIIADLKSRPVDPEEHALLHNIHQTKISGHLGRGFVILDTNAENETIALCEVTDYFDQAMRPLCFVYSGMGSQWTGMGKALMRIPIFAAAIERCHRVLEPKGVDIVDIITSDDKKMFDNILHSFVGIAAIQIGLTDILRELEIFPDMIIGHSVGELGCAYADGCFTAEEMILSAYSRGLVSVQTPLIRGSMAAVGLGYREISKLCPPEIEVACHNASDSSTISGPAEVMSEFVNSLVKRGVFAKEVPCSNIAYHSRYIADAGPGLLKYLREVIKSPKARSPRWVSTSVPQDRWEEPVARYSSAEYHTNNLLNSVLFEETSKLIPPNAMVIEVAPHGLLQAILKRSLPESCCLLPLTRRGHPDNARFLLEAIGKLSMEGFNPKVKVLYPRVEFPVSTGTPMLSHLIEWAHSERWTLTLYATANRRSAAAAKFVLSTLDDEHRYLRGHVLRGKNLYPFAAALVCVWDTFTMSLDLLPKTQSVRFRDVYLHTQPLLHDQRQLRLSVSLHRGTGRFEILNDHTVVAEGTIIEYKNTSEVSDVARSAGSKLESKDVYQLLQARDYDYSDDFRSIYNVNEALTEAEIVWSNNWITFIDGIIQLNMLRREHDTISKANFIQDLVIDVDKHNSVVQNNSEDNNLMKANVLDVLDTTICGGVAIRSIKFLDLPAIKEESMSFKTLKFCPFFPSNNVDEDTPLHIYLQIVADNIKKEYLNIVEVADESEVCFNNIEFICNNVPGVKGNYTKINKKYALQTRNTLTNVDLLLVTNLSGDEQMCQMLYRMLKHNSLLINKDTSKTAHFQTSSLYQVISAHSIGNTKLELAVWRPTNPNTSSTLKIRLPQDPTLLPSMGVCGGEYYLPVDDKFDLQQGGMLKCANISDIDSLHWVKASLDNDAGIKVHYAGVNMVEVNKQLGVILNTDKDQKIEIDFSGITKCGKRVMGVTQTEAISSIVNANTELLWPIPTHWSFEDAATVPLPYSMGFYILFVRADLLPGHSVFVQGGTGALGQAIISIALAHGCQVFTSVSSTSKKQFLRKLYPQLKDEHIGNTRDTSFGDSVLSATRGRGCDVVVCCVRSAELKSVAIKCTAICGRTFDVSIIKNRDQFSLGMHSLTYDRSYALINFASIFKEDSLDIVKRVKLLMSEGIARGYVRPLTRVTYAPQDAARAYRLQAAGRQRGRVLLDLTQLKANVQPRIVCSSQSWQLLISDNEPLALKIAEKLINEGAKKLAILLNGASNCVDIKSRLWSKNGVEVKVLAGDMWSEPRVSGVIQACRTAGSVESIFVITSNTCASQYKEMENSLLAIANKFKISPKYFALVNTGRMSNIQTSLPDLREQKITKIILPGVKMMDSEVTGVNEDLISLNSAVNALERALCSNESKVLVHTCEKPKVSLVQQLLKLAEISTANIPEVVSPELTLQDLIIDHSKLNVLQAYLRDVHEIFLKTEDIPQLTLAEIYHMEKSLSVFDFTDTNGLASYLSVVGDDELMATTNMIFLPTLMSSTTKRDDEFELYETYLCIIPGVEGHHSRFTDMCERLKMPALVLQPGLDWKCENVQKLAQIYTGILRERTKLKERFILLGYESGVLVALEMAAILESSGLSGTVFCVGGTPEEVVADFKYNLREYETDQQLQTAVLKHMYTLMTRENSHTVDSLLDDKMDWHEKVNICVNTLHGRISHSTQYTIEVIKSAYERLTHVLQYTPTPKTLRSKVISLRPRYSAEVESLVQQGSNLEVSSLYQLRAPLSMVTQDLECTSIINRNLDNDILEEYYNKNHCDTYITNADTFMDIER